jgi:ribosomal-protein-alanine N-acetyltransferase
MRPATAPDLNAIRQLFSTGRHVYRATGDEDLPALVERRRAMVGDDLGRLWGFAGLDLEARPPTLPPSAPDRAYLRALALATGHRPTPDGARLMAATVPTLRPHPRPILLIAHAQESWLGDLVTAAGLALCEKVQTFRLTRLTDAPIDKWSHRERWPASVHIRPLHPTDLEAVAELDAAAFEPLWHYSAKELWQLLFTGQLHGAFVEGRLVGYTGMTLHGEEAHLTRIAVHPAWQGRMIGRQLLAAAIQNAQQQGVRQMTLNTQVSNQRSQRLYLRFGFLPTTQITHIYTQILAAESLQSSDQSP